MTSSTDRSRSLPRRFLDAALMVTTALVAGGCELGQNLDDYTAGATASAAGSQGGAAMGPSTGGASAGGKAGASGKSGGSGASGATQAGGHGGVAGAAAGVGGASAGTGGVGAAGHAGASTSKGGASAGSAGTGGATSSKGGSSGSVGTGGGYVAGMSGAGGMSAPTTCDGEPEGTYRCSAPASADLQKCAAGKWSTATSCDPGQLCDTTKPHTTSSNPTPVLCAPVVTPCIAHAGQTVCDASGNLIKCGKDSVSSSPVASCSPTLCPTALALGGTACPDCVPGDQRCQGGNVSGCDSSGHWAVTATCPAANPCNDSTSMCSGKACSPTEVTCSGNTVVTCDVNGTTASGDCPMGCTNGTCNACSPGAQQCNGNTQMTCVGGQWSSSGCAAPTPVCTGGACVACNSVADCTKTNACDAVACSNNVCVHNPYGLGDQLCGVHCCDSGIDQYCNGSVCKIMTCGCFAAGTAVTMADGTTRAIEAIHVGDEVAAFDTALGVITRRRVTETFVHEADAITDAMWMLDDELLVTGNHPFFAHGKWVRADSLVAGDELVELAGADAAPRSIRSMVRVPGRPRTFNLEVEGEHDYFAGGRLVHNKLPCQ